MLGREDGHSDSEVGVELWERGERGGAEDGDAGTGEEAKCVCLLSLKKAHAGLDCAAFQPALERLHLTVRAQRPRA